MIENYLDSEALAFHSYENALIVQKALLEEGYCVMLSREEELWLVNWVWTERFANRNDVIFVNRAEYECNWWAFLKQHPEIKWEDED